MLDRCCTNEDLEEGVFLVERLKKSPSPQYNSTQKYTTALHVTILHPQSTAAKKDSGDHRTASISCGADSTMVHEEGPPITMMEDVGDAQAEADRWNSKGMVWMWPGFCAAHAFFLC